VGCQKVNIYRPTDFQIAASDYRHLAQSCSANYGYEMRHSTLKLFFGLAFIVLVPILVPAEAQGAQEVSFVCTTDVPDISLKIFTTAQQSKVGERIQLSSTSKGVTYWKVPLRATEIEEGTVTYESSEGVLVSRRTGKPIPGKMQLLVTWNDDAAIFSLFMPRGFNVSQVEGECH
jgi:hypothetical protein